MKHSGFKLTMLTLLLAMSWGHVWAADYDIGSSGVITITKDNVSLYDGKTISGTKTDTKNQLIIDGATVKLTIEDLSIIMDVDGTYNGITLQNGADVTLVVKGTNYFQGSFGGAGIAVPEGCTLTISSESTGTLTAIGGDRGNGGAGIGSCDKMDLGTINIAGGTIIAKGGSASLSSNGAAGIGGCDGHIGGTINITGGNITATGGLASAAIGGGNRGAVSSINISNATVRAELILGTANGAAIGSGVDVNVGAEPSDMLSCGTIVIGPNCHIYAGGNIGHGEMVIGSNEAAGGSVSVDPTSAVSYTGEICPLASGTTIYPYSFDLTINDEQLTDDVPYATVMLDGKIYHADITVRTTPVGEVTFKIASPTVLTGAHELTLSDGKNTWKTNIGFMADKFSYSATIGYKYDYSFTINDARLTTNLSDASVTINNKTYTGKTLNVAEKYAGTVSGIFTSPTELQTAGAFSIKAGDYTWLGNVDYQSGTYRYSKEVGNKLYPVYLWFYNAAITGNLTGCTATATQGGAVLGSDNLAVSNVIELQTAGTGRMTLYMPAGAATDVSVKHASLNGGSALTRTGQTIVPNTTDNNIVMLDEVGVLSSMDLANGNITIEDEYGKLKFSYYDDSKTLQTAVRQSYVNTYEIKQTNSGTATTPNTLTIKNTKGEVKLLLNGLNIQTTQDVDIISMENAQVKLLLQGNIKLQRYRVSNGDQSANAVRVSSNSALTIEDYLGDSEVGSLDTGTPNYFGTGIGGRRVYGTSVTEATGNITINSGIITATGFSAAGIGNSDTSTGRGGKITINGGTVTATTGQYSSAIGGLGASCNVEINGGNVTATGGPSSTAIGGGLTSGGSVTINGGYVKAIGGQDAGAIGGIGASTKAFPCPDITISGGTIVAVAGTNGVSIGRGLNGTGGSLTITGGNISATSTNLTATNGKDNGCKYLYQTGEMNAGQFSNLPVKHTYYNVNGASDIDGKYYAFIPYSYTATWVVEGTVMEVDSVTDYMIPAYKGTTPTKTDDQALYLFKGWTPEVTALTGNETFTAQFSALRKDGDTYLISNADEWRLFAYAASLNTSANAKMTADVNLGTDQSMIGSSGKAYAGTFDGQGHVLTIGLNLGGSYVAPFSYVAGATIKNLKVTGTLVSGGNHPGGLIGCLDRTATISQCEVNVAINVTYDGYAYLGGMVGELKNQVNDCPVLADCSFTGSITGTHIYGCGGFLYLSNGSYLPMFKNCVFAGSFNASNPGGSASTFKFANFDFYSIKAENGLIYPSGTGWILLGPYSWLSLSDAVALLQGTSRTDEVWIYDPTANCPMLKIFAKAAQTGITSAGRGTYYNSTAWSVPTGMKVYTVNSVDNGYARAVEYTGKVVPAGTAVIVDGAAGDYTLNFARDDQQTAPADNILKGTDVATSLTSTDDYLYQFSYGLSTSSNKDVLGFWWQGATSTGHSLSNGAHKAYLQGNYGNSAVRGFELDFGDLTDGIKTAVDAATSDGPWFTIGGQRLNGRPTQGGLYINNGHKVIIK